MIASGLQRCSSIPPAQAGAQSRFPAIEVLTELPPPLGVPLWQLVRDIQLWNANPADSRESMFAEKSARVWRDSSSSLGVPEDLAAAVDRLGDVLQDPAASAADAHVILTSCMAIAQWAERTFAGATATQFALTGAAVVPRSGAAAVEAASVALRCGRPDLAEVWFLRGIALARRAGEWHAYGSGCIGLGQVFRAQDRMFRARRLFLRAMRTARRHSDRDVGARAARELFEVAMELGDGESARRFGVAAIRWLGSTHPEVASIRRAFAAFRIDHSGAAPAIRLLEKPSIEPSGRGDP